MTYVVIKNTAGFEAGGETNASKSYTRVSDVTVTLSNHQQYNFAPGETHTLPEPYASEALAQDNRLSEVSRS